MGGEVVLWISMYGGAKVADVPRSRLDKVSFVNIRDPKKVLCSTRIQSATAVRKGDLKCHIP